MNFRQSILVLLVLAISACQSRAPSTPAQTGLQRTIEEQRLLTEKNGALQQLPTEVSLALQGKPVAAKQPLFDSPKYDIKVENAPVAAFFSGLVKDTPYSVAVHPKVSGSISLDLKQVDIQQVMDLVSELYGFDIQRSSKVFRVFPSGMRTETFSVNYLLMQRAGITQTRIASGGVSQFDSNNTGSSGNGLNGGSFTGNNSTGSSIGNSSNSNGPNGTNISTSTETDFWSDLRNTLQAMIGNADGRNVLVTPQAGLVTVRALPNEIRDVRRFLQISEENVQRQVVLEARIIEVSLSDGYQQGINWTKILANSGSTEFTFANTAGNYGNKISTALGGVTTLSFLNKDFSGVLSLLSTQGNVQVLSSPRVTATNNQKAVIKVGDDEYFVTEVSAQNTVTSSSTQVTPSIELTPFFSGIALDVTPQIDDKGGVLLHVHPSVIDTREQEKVVTLNNERYILPLAQSNIRESDTVIRAQSGEIVVIGGLMQSTTNNRRSQTPLLGDIPLLGQLFKNRNEQQAKRELVILIKPTVVGAGTWRQQIEQSSTQVQDWLYVD